MERADFRRGCADGTEGAQIDGPVRRGRGRCRRFPKACPVAARRLPLRPAADNPAPDALVPSSVSATPRHQPIAPGRRRKEPRSKFKTYPIGFFHVDIAEVQTAQGKLYLFVAIDRTSKFAVAQLVHKANMQAARAFLEALVAAVPYRVEIVLTDNGIQFADLPKNRSGPTAKFRGHPFDRVCREHGIDHRLTKPNHPWTTDVIDKCFLTGSALFSSRARATAWRRAGREAQALPRSLHHRPSVAAPVRACLGPRGFQPETKRAYAVSACSTHLRS